MNCYLELYLKKEEIYENCADCPDNCDSFLYEMTPAFTRYPEFKYAVKLIDSSAFLRQIFTDVKANYSLIKDSLVSFHVFYSDLKYIEIKELEKQSLIDLICSIGGTLGLFIGASILSFVEILEAIFTLILVSVDKKKTQREKNYSDVFL
jgi:hypothetical protein